MAEISGENGAVYYNEGIYDKALADSIYYSTGTANYIITSSTDDGATGFINFEDEGYTTGMLVTISGSSDVGAGANNRTYTINAVSSGVLTVAEALTTGLDGGTPTFTEEEPGIPVLGFYNWSLSYTGDVLEITDFDDSTGGRSYIPGLTGWTATAEKHFLLTNNEVDDWVGETCEIRLFAKYVAISTTGNTSQYWKGDTVITGLDMTTPVDALINQSISFQGDRALTYKVQTDPWSCGIS